MSSQKIARIVVSRLAAAWLLSALAVCASEAPAPEEIPELGDILVSGEKPNRDPQQIIEWIRRLIGEFRYSGYVESFDADAAAQRRLVRGLGQCKPFGASPAVLCEMNVTWPTLRGPDGEEIPGGRSTLRPAVFVLGLDPDRLGVRFLLVDNKGMGNGARSYLRGSSVSATMPCVDMPPDCRRISHIHAQPDGKVVRMQFDIEQDFVRIARLDFVLDRIEPGEATP